MQNIKKHLSLTVVIFSMIMILVMMSFAGSFLKQVASAPYPSLLLSLGVGAICLILSAWLFKKAVKLSQKIL